MKKTLKRIAIQSCMPIEGPLYAVQFEDSIGHCYDWSFEAYTSDGKLYVLRFYRVEGSVRGEEGFLCPNYQARGTAACFAQRVEDHGSIDPALWDETPARDTRRELMESWSVTEAQCARVDEIVWEASGRPAHSAVRR